MRPTGNSDRFGQAQEAVCASGFPHLIETEEELDEVLTRPSKLVVEAVERISSPLIILGAGGKMGPSLAILAKRAAEASGRKLDVIAVSRFSNAQVRAWLENRGVRTVACDLLDARSVAGLPDSENLIYLVGLKFGTRTNPAATWAINTLVPAIVCERYAGSRIVALSTGNVYPMVAIDAGKVVESSSADLRPELQSLVGGQVESADLSRKAGQLQSLAAAETDAGGSVETDPLTPLGEYSNAAVGRERIFEHCAERYDVRVALLRLFYATELRYGVVCDIAQWIHRGEPVPLANGWFNCIWQGDANGMILRAFDLTATPPSAWNLCGPEIFSVRAVAELVGRELGTTPRFSGSESGTALLGNAGKLCAELGPPQIGIEKIARWTAHWISIGGRTLSKPTHFDVRDGQY